MQLPPEQRLQTERIARMVPETGITDLYDVSISSRDIKPLSPPASEKELQHAPI